VLLPDDRALLLLAVTVPALPRNAYAEIVSGRERLGRTIGTADAQIAAVCRAVGATLANRNTTDFEETGIGLIGPWQPA